MRITGIAPTVGGIWLSRPKGERAAEFRPFYLWALTWDFQVLPYDPVAGRVLVDHDILSPMDDPMDLVDALDEAEDTFAE